ncbi:MAG TPA: hypothetical protein VI796_06325 [Candidatus Thermoplasmatota archaeon]|nr:hypothetical protein [Candidatus Thermoplasmatota archaeon]
MASVPTFAAQAVSTRSGRDVTRLRVATFAPGTAGAVVVERGFATVPAATASTRIGE